MKTDKQAPIGVFDSGVGGLTVAREIMRNLPGERIVYFGDTARVPYGSKSRQTIIRYSRQIVRFLRTQDVKAIVVACNTASALALSDIEKEIDIPIIGVMKPGARAAAAATKNGRIGVIGTESTIRSGMYSRFLQEINPNITVVGKACPLFVPLVEEALENGEEMLVMMAHGGSQMAIMERYGLPRHDYYHWCGPNAGGYVLEADAAAWHRDHTLALVGEVQYVRKEDEQQKGGDKA